MKYTIYKITNKVNGKIYIGKHQTKDLTDNYMGSGKMLRRAQSKYGLENFVREILHVFDTEEEMNAKEAELVTEEFCMQEDTYNICVGGQGGFSYINSIKTYEQRQAAGRAGGFSNPTEYIKKRRAEGSILGYENGIGKWRKNNKAVTEPGLKAMQSDAANKKRKQTMSGAVSVYDLYENRIVRFTRETRNTYDENKDRYLGIRRAKKLGLI